MTHRLTTNDAKNYCNRTLIVKVIVENVVTCFFWDTVYLHVGYGETFKYNSAKSQPIVNNLGLKVNVP